MFWPSHFEDLNNRFLLRQKWERKSQPAFLPQLNDSACSRSTSKNPESNMRFKENLESVEIMGVTEIITSFPNRNFSRWLFFVFLVPSFSRGMSMILGPFIKPLNRTHSSKHTFRFIVHIIWFWLFNIIFQVLKLKIISCG